MEKRRVLPAVRGIHAGAALEQTTNRLGTPGAYRAMQRRRARSFLVLDIRSRVEQQPNHQPLLRRVPRLTPWPRIARIVERQGSSPVCSMHVCAGVDQRLNDGREKRGGREVERRVSDVQLMGNVLDEALDSDTRPREFGRLSYEPDGSSFVGDDGVEEHCQRQALGIVR